MRTALPCVCGEYDSIPWAVVDLIDIVECKVCKVKRVQSIDTAVYESRYTSGSYHSEDRSYDTGHKAHAERIEHDRRVARIRLDKLNRLNTDKPFKFKGTLLDVGCSNGAFLYEAEQYGYTVSGCDLSIDAIPNDAPFAPRIRKGGITDCNWQRRSFDYITFNDVLEHIPDPVKAIRYAKGILKRTGMLIIDIPDMGSKDALEQGAKFKHVKPHEHLWYFTATQLRALLEREGFNIVWMDAPIAGKATVYACPETSVEKVTIYGPPGIGDILWTLYKLPDIQKREAPCQIHYVVCVDGEVKLATRAKDLLGLCPYVDSYEFTALPLPSDTGCPDPSKADYNLIANDWLQPQGKMLEDWRPELPNTWDIGLAPPEAARKQVDARLRGVGPFAAIYMSSFVWNREVAMPVWTPRHWAELCIKLADSGLRPVILGAEWDLEFTKDVAVCIVELGRDPNKVWVNTAGRTTLGLAMAYMEVARMTIGLAAGLPILGASLGYQTLIIWPRKGGPAKLQWETNFEIGWLPPKYRGFHHTIGQSYKSLPIGTFTVDDIVKEAKYK